MAKHCLSSRGQRKVHQSQVTTGLVTKHLSRYLTEDCKFCHFRCKDYYMYN